MRHILFVWSVAAMMAVMLVASAAPAFAVSPNPVNVVADMATSLDPTRVTQDLRFNPPPPPPSLNSVPNEIGVEELVIAHEGLGRVP